MAEFSVILLTAVPTHLAGEGAGAFIKVDGRESLLRSVELFLNRSNVKQIQLVVSHEQMEDAKKKFGGHLGFSGVKLVAGGKGWMEQVAAGAEKISPESSHVLVHDAARPIVAFSDLDTLMDEGEIHPIAVLTAPIRSELVEVDEAGQPVAIHAAKKFCQVTTPWVFRKDKFLEMVKSRREPTADQIWLVRGSPLNTRLSHAGDANLAKVMIGMLPKPKMRATDNPFEEAQW